MTKTLFAVLAAISLACAAHAASGAKPDADARDLLRRFVAAQNAHDPARIRPMLWDSPQMLFFSRGVATQGADAVTERFEQYYRGTWHLQPDMTQFRSTAITNDVIQVIVPIRFERGLPGAAPQSDRFLICQTYIRDSNGWRVASILPVANTQLK